MGVEAPAGATETFTAEDLIRVQEAYAAAGGAEGDHESEEWQSAYQEHHDVLQGLATQAEAAGDAVLVIEYRENLHALQNEGDKVDGHNAEALADAYSAQGNIEKAKEYYTYAMTAYTALGSTDAFIAAQAKWQELSTAPPSAE